MFGRWSFSIQNADFSLTTISMTNDQGINIPLTIEPITNGYGDNTIVWVPDPSCINNLFGSEDTKYTINILNVNNTVQQNYNYEIVIMTHNNGGNLVHPPNCPNLTIWNEDSCACINQTTYINEVNHKKRALQKVKNILGKETKKTKEKNTNKKTKRKIYKWCCKQWDRQRYCFIHFQKNRTICTIWL